jgi:hypothetical protein
MQLVVQVGTTELLALVDSGSTHNFIRDEVIGELGLKVRPRPDMKVTVANGEKVTSAGIVHELPVSIDQESFSINLYSLPLDGFDIVLGVQWLRTLGPILWDFDSLFITFWRKDHQVTWKGKA